jgi:hypothetical protein
VRFVEADQIELFEKRRRSGQGPCAPCLIQVVMRVKSSGQKANDELRGIGPLPGVGGAFRRTT